MGVSRPDACLHRIDVDDIDAPVAVEISRDGVGAFLDSVRGCPTGRCVPGAGESQAVQRHAAAVGIGGPGIAIVIDEVVRRISCGVIDLDAFAAVVQAAGKLAGDQTSVQRQGTRRRTLLDS